ncbi:MAG: DNA circularization N-terminal domain-containing protein [Thermosynechococcaceae cyanobacterium]
MAVELAGIQLNRVHKISTLEKAALVHHRIPGLEGNIVQTLGRDSVQLQIEGIFYGATAAEDLEGLREVYKQRDPVDFLAEIVGQSYFGQVMVERFEVQQLAQDPDQFSYTLTVAEFVKPPEPEVAAAGFPDVDTSILDEAQSFMDIATLPDLLGSVPEIANPLTPLSTALDGVKQAMEPLDGATAGLKELFGIP